MKTTSLFKKLFSNNLDDSKRKEIEIEIKSRMERKEPFTIDDFNSVANWVNKKNKNEQ